LDVPLVNPTQIRDPFEELCPAPIQTQDMAKHICSIGFRMKSVDHPESEYLIGGLEHEFYDFPYIGNKVNN
jgi:hypothetical protein